MISIVETEGGAAPIVTPQFKRKDYDIKEAAAVLRVSTKTIRRYINQNKLRRCLKMGRIRIPAVDIDNFFDA